MQRILIFGNSGSGKTTMARELARTHALTHLDLDQLAWDTPGVRRPIADSAAAIDAFVTEHPEWVIEGCYGDLLEIVVPHATELRFLNPGVDACIANCRSRPFEPEKYPTKEAQDEKLAFLLDWVRQYDARTDEYSLRRHRRIFESFAGPKHEVGASAP